MKSASAPALAVCILLSTLLPTYAGAGGGGGGCGSGGGGGGSGGGGGGGGAGGGGGGGGSGAGVLQWQAKWECEQGFIRGGRFCYPFGMGGFSAPAWYPTSLGHLVPPRQGHVSRVPRLRSPHPGRVVLHAKY